jgi:hypothetical protein
MKLYTKKPLKGGRNMIKKLGFAIYDLYEFFFNLKINPLRHIPNPFTQFILMFYLSVMWTAIFTFWAGYTIYFGIYSVGGHLMVVGGFFITAMTFKDAEKNGHLWVQRFPPADRKKNKTVWDLEKEG